MKWLCVHSDQSEFHPAANLSARAAHTDSLITANELIWCETGFNVLFIQLFASATCMPMTEQIRLQKTHKTTAKRTFLYIIGFHLGFNLYSIWRDRSIVSRSLFKNTQSVGLTLVAMFTIQHYQNDDE